VIFIDRRRPLEYVQSKEATLTRAGGKSMILQTAQLSTNQKAAIEEKNIAMCGVASDTARANALQQMRYRLALLDASQRRLSIADSMAALLGEGGAELPA
jgi:hypothetical protein